MSANLIYVPLSDCCPQVLVITWHDHLHKVFVVKHLVIIGVKVLYDVVGICFSGLLHSVVSQKLEDFKRSDSTVLVPINSLES